MDFSIETVQKIEKDLNLVVRDVLKSCKVQSVDEINHALLMKQSCCSKDALATFVERLLKLSSAKIELCKSAGGQIDRLKTERIQVQQTVIDLQQKQMQQVQETVKSSVQTSVKTEMNLWSDVVQRNTKSAAPSVKSVQKAVRTAVEENVRSNNFIIYGAEEEEPDEHGIERDNVTSQLFNEIDAFPTTRVLTVTRIGPVKPLGETETTRPRCRPIKVTLASPEAMKFVMSKAKKLKQNPYKEYQNIYLSPDRSREERAAHKSLVAQLKQKITDDPKKYHIIRDGKIKTVDKKLSAS